MASAGDTGSPEGPGDINDRLAEIAAELASEARFKEPSAAERARARAAAARHSAKTGRTGRLRQWRARKKAAELRRPVEGGSAILKPAPPQPTARQIRRASRAARPVADRGYTDTTEYPSVARSIIAVIVIVILLVGVSIGLRYLFRHYGATSGASGPAVVRTLAPRSEPGRQSDQTVYLIK